MGEAVNFQFDLYCHIIDKFLLSAFVHNMGCKSFVKIARENTLQLLKTW